MLFKGTAKLIDVTISNQMNDITDGASFSEHVSCGFHPFARNIGIRRLMELFFEQSGEIYRTDTTKIGETGYGEIAISQMKINIFECRGNQESFTRDAFGIAVSHKIV